MGDQPSAERRAIAQKLDHLIEMLHLKVRGPYSYQKIADLIRQRAAAPPSLAARFTTLPSARCPTLGPV